MLRSVTILLISAYQKTLSPDHGLLKHFYPQGACRYQPTCSEYTKESVTRYGAAKGLYLGAKRVGRCHPWARGGHDPVL